jgi:hypothetical protein
MECSFSLNGQPMSALRCGPVTVSAFSGLGDHANRREGWSCNEEVLSLRCCRARRLARDGAPCALVVGASRGDSSIATQALDMVGIPLRSGKWRDLRRLGVGVCASGFVRDRSCGFDSLLSPLAPAHQCNKRREWAAFRAASRTMIVLRADRQLLLVHASRMSSSSVFAAIALKGARRSAVHVRRYVVFPVRQVGITLLRSAEDICFGGRGNCGLDHYRANLQVQRHVATRDQYRYHDHHVSYGLLDSTHPESRHRGHTDQA